MNLKQRLNTLAKNQPTDTSAPLRTRLGLATHKPAYKLAQNHHQEERAALFFVTVIASITTAIAAITIIAGIQP